MRRGALRNRFARRSGRRVPAPLRRVDTQPSSGGRASSARLRPPPGTPRRGRGRRPHRWRSGQRQDAPGRAVRSRVRRAGRDRALRLLRRAGARAVRALRRCDRRERLDAAALEERLASVPGDRLFLVLDDLQWADRATLALLSRLVRATSPTTARRRRLPGGRRQISRSSRPSPTCAATASSSGWSSSASGSRRWPR